MTTMKRRDFLKTGALAVAGTAATITGLVHGASADSAAPAFKTLKPGFSVVNDISKFRPMTQVGVDHQHALFLARQRSRQISHHIGFAHTALAAGDGENRRRRE